MHVVLCAVAARAVDRPVKIVLTRDQMFTSTGHRPRTYQDLSLIADTGGSILGTEHHTLTETSTVAHFCEPAGLSTRFLYSSPAWSYPIEPRESTRPHRVSCAARARRRAVCARVRHRRTGRATRHGPARPARAQPRRHRSGQRQTMVGQAPARVLPRRCTPVRLERSASDPAGDAPQRHSRRLGHGDRDLPWPPDARGMSRGDRRARQRAILIGHTRSRQRRAHRDDAGRRRHHRTADVPGDVPFWRLAVPGGPYSGASQTTATVGSAVFAAATEWKRRFVDAVVRDPDSPFHGCEPSSVDISALPPETAAAYRDTLSFDITSDEGEQRAEAFQSFGAHFCEVEVDEQIGRASVTRWVAVMDCGRVLNPKLARNQVMGGITFGLGMALLEQVPYDETTALPIGEYYLPTHADRPEFDISFIDEPDYGLDPIGVRGIGEIGTCGVPAAIANAIHHATGTRLRHLPITLEDLMRPYQPPDPTS